MRRPPSPVRVTGRGKEGAEILPLRLRSGLRLVDADSSRRALNDTGKNDTGKRTSEQKWRPRHFAINTGCRGHPAQGGAEPTVGSALNKVIYPSPFALN